MGLIKVEKWKPWGGGFLLLSSSWGEVQGGFLVPPLSRAVGNSGRFTRECQEAATKTLLLLF